MQWYNEACPRSNRELGKMRVLNRSFWHLPETDLEALSSPHKLNIPAVQTMEFFNDFGGDPLKPSLFELIAQEQLKDLLQPALKYVLAVRDTPRSNMPQSSLCRHRYSLKDTRDIYYALSIDMRSFML